MAALSKDELDAETAEWRERCAALGYDAVDHQGNQNPGDPPHTKELPQSKKADVRLIIKGVIEAVAPHIVALEKQVAALAARIEELERKGYCGVWKSGKEYSPQSEVTCDGGRWISHKRTSDKPGLSADWSLMEKSFETSHARNGSALPPASPRTS